LNDTAFISNVIFVGGAEFKPHINRIMVDFGSSSLVPLPPSSLLTTPQFLNHTERADHEPLPSIEGCGLYYQHSSEPDAQPQLHHPFPLQKDVGGSLWPDEGFAEGE